MLISRSDDRFNCLPISFVVTLTRIFLLLLLFRNYMIVSKNREIFMDMWSACLHGAIYFVLCGFAKPLVWPKWTKYLTNCSHPVINCHLRETYKIVCFIVSTLKPYTNHNRLTSNKLIKENQKLKPTRRRWKKKTRIMTIYVTTNTAWSNSIRLHKIH